MSSLRIIDMKASQHASTQSAMFTLPKELEASEPPEIRGQGRDDVRLMVSRYKHDSIDHNHFKNIADYLKAGDVVVINTSSTRKASLAAQRAEGESIRVHISTQLRSSQWIVELRRLDEHGTQPLLDAYAGETLNFPKGGHAHLIRAHGRPYNPTDQVRLWLADLELPLDVDEYLNKFGAPIRYNYVPEEWDAMYYQTAFANQTGSAEMPSAGRAFTPEIITQLVARGVLVLPLTLHTGVASQEAHESPYEEYYAVPTITAEMVNAARQRGSRILAVGTTVVRALETQTDKNGITRSGNGWTDLVITPQSGIRSVNALLTGFHEPQASHLAMLEALAGRSHIERNYEEALAKKYLWHEFGDLHLILP